MTQLVLDICLLFSATASLAGFAEGGCGVCVSGGVCAHVSVTLVQLGPLEGTQNPILLLHMKAVPLPAFLAASLASRDPPL